MAKTLAGLAREMARDAETVAGKAAGLVRKAVVFGLVYSKLNNRSLSTGMDHAAGALDGLPEFTAGYVKKALSNARAVAEHGTVNGTLIKALALGSADEGDMIAEATALIAHCDVRAACEARVSANAGKKGGRPPKAEPKAPAPAPVPTGDPVQEAETQAMVAIAALIEAGATDALGRITAALLKVAQPALDKKAA